MVTTDHDTALQALAQINPAALEYDDWLAVGMALKDAGCSLAEWDAWSARDPKRYKPREMPGKWASFRGRNGKPVGIGTLVKLCRDHGGSIETHAGSGGEGKALDWDAAIGPRENARTELQVVRQEWLQDAPLPPEPNGNWDGRADLAAYLRTLFNSDERVGIVTESWEQDEPEGGKRYLPRKGVWDRTAGELLETLACAQDLGEVVGDWNSYAGAWIRFNPLDGEGCSDVNVTAFRFALVESDDISVERQHAIYRQLELPIAALVHSGGKSLHAIVRIDAPDYKEYVKRVDFLYDVCRKNGLVIDRKNRNPSRLSRLPGATRNGRKQWLVATGIGQPTWAEWADWIAAVNDDLPDVETAADFVTNPPPLADGLIDGVLRAGHKMLLAGPSKAGKSFLLLQLALAIAEGRKWLGWQCAQGRVLYVNLELDRASVYNRLADIYRLLGIALPGNAASIDVWNLRGKAMAMDRLAPKLIRRAAKRQYSAVIIDPIYKVITGDENAADQMAKFCNQFDRVCFELGAAVIYCHHHSKGQQGQKRAHDRASGSGVFARDPDALLDMIELEIDDTRRKQVHNRWECAAMAAALDLVREDWRETCPQDEAVVADKLAHWAHENGLGDAVRESRPPAFKAASHASGWRIEGILREYPTIQPRRFWYRWPLHVLDEDGLLDDALAEGEDPPRKSREQANAQRQIEATADTWEAYRKAKDEAGDEPVTVADIAPWMTDSKTGEQGISERAARTRLDRAGFARDKRTGHVTEGGDET